MLECVMSKNRTLLLIAVLLISMLKMVLVVKSQEYEAMEIEQPQEKFNFIQGNGDQRFGLAFRDTNQLETNNPTFQGFFVEKYPTDVRQRDLFQNMGFKLSGREAPMQTTPPPYCIGPDGKIVENVSGQGQKSNVNITVANSESIKSPSESTTGISNSQAGSTSITSPSNASASASSSGSSPKTSSTGSGAGDYTSSSAGSPNAVGEKTKELQKIIQELYVAQAQVQLEATEIQRAQAIASSAQSGLEEAANNVRIITAALHAAQQTVASAAMRAQSAQLQLAAHDQLLFTARQRVDALSAQMVGLQAEEGIGSPKVVVDIPALLNKLKQPLAEEEKPTPIPSILGGKSRRYSNKNVINTQEHRTKFVNEHGTMKKDLNLNTDEIINGDELTKFNEDLLDVDDNNDYMEDELENSNAKVEVKPFNREIKKFTDQDIKDLVEIIVSAATEKNLREKNNELFSALNDPSIIQTIDPSKTIRKKQDQQYINNFLKNIQNADMSKFNKRVKLSKNDEKANITEKVEVKRKDPNINEYLLKFQASLLRPHLRPFSSSLSSPRERKDNKRYKVPINEIENTNEII